MNQLRTAAVRARVALVLCEAILKGLCDMQGDGENGRTIKRVHEFIASVFASLTEALRANECDE